MANTKISRFQAFPLPVVAPPLLSVGGELKSTFVLAQKNSAYISKVMGDLKDYETLQAFEKAIAEGEDSLGISPEIIAYDIHPNYLATRYALDRAQSEGLTAIGTQHHHAHIAACMADNEYSGGNPVIGICFDGTGFGEDGAIWGGEILLADYKTSRRFAHLRYAPLPGGDAAIREPWRMALSWLHTAGLGWPEDLPVVQYASSIQTEGLPAAPLQVISHQLSTGVNAPRTSSMGRLFDSVSSLLGLCQIIDYEAEAAITLEKAADLQESASYPFKILSTGEDFPREIDPALMFVEMLHDLRNGVSVPAIAARFHNTIAWMVVAVCQEIRWLYGLDEVALSGGVWNNRTLLSRIVPLLQKDGFRVLLHRRVSTGDAGLALGQSAIAGSLLQA